MPEKLSGTFRYDAFISYRHVEPDKTIAEKLHKMLETYRVPSNIAKKAGIKRIKRVFRDRDELPSSSNLAENIREALCSSRFLIVVCSPRAIKSNWVLKEVDTFIEMHGHDRVLALLIEGEPGESFPPQLTLVPFREASEGGGIKQTLKEVEPLAADIRGKDTREMIKKLKVEQLRLIATILGCTFDDLRQRHRERAIRNVITVSVCLSAFFLAFGSFSTWQAVRIREQVNKTLKGQSLYLSDISGQVLDEGDRRMAMLLALKALPENMSRPERPYVEEAEFALSESLAAYRFNDGYRSDISLDHKKNVKDIVLSPDGSLALTACCDGNYYIWNTSDGSRLFSLRHDMVSPVAGNALFSKDSKGVTAVTEDGIASWDTGSGKLLWSVKTNEDCIEANPDCSIIAAGYRDVSLYDNKTGKKLSTITMEGSDDFSNFSYVRSFRFSDDGSKLAIGTSSGLVVVEDVKSGREILKFRTAFPSVDNLAFSPDGKRLSVISNLFDLNNLFSKGKGNLTVLDCTDGSTICVVNSSQAAMKLAKFSGTDPNTLVYTADVQANVFDIPSERIKASFSHGGTVSSLLMSDNGKLFVTSASDGTVRFFSLERNMEYDWERIEQKDGISSLATAKGIFAVSSDTSEKAYIYRIIDIPNLSRMAGLTDYAGSGKFSGDGKTAVTLAISGNEVCVWDSVKRKLSGKLSGAGKEVIDVRFAPDGKHILTVSREGLVKQWDPLTLKATSEFNLKQEISQMAYSSDGTLLSLCGEESSEVIDVNGFKRVSGIKGNAIMQAPVFSPDGGRLLIIGTYNESAVYDVKTGKELNKFKELPIRCGIFSPDSRYLYAASEDKAYVISMTDYKVLKTIGSTGMKITSVSLDFYGNSLLLGLDDKTVQVYDIKAGAVKYELSGNTSYVSRCLFRDEGKTLITIGDSNDAVIWNAGNYKKLAYISRILDIDAGMKHILTSSNYDVILSPLYDTSALVREAKKQLGNRKLTEKDAERYFIVG